MYFYCGYVIFLIVNYHTILLNLCYQMRHYERGDFDKFIWIFFALFIFEGRKQCESRFGKQTQKTGLIYFYISTNWIN